MTSLTKFSRHEPSWKILVCFVGTFGLSACAGISTPMGSMNIFESGKNGTEEAVTLPTPTPPPSIQDVEEAISSTKTLLDDQQNQIGGLLSLRGEVKQTLREFHDENLTPMQAAIQVLQHQVGGWENTSTTNQETLSSTIGQLRQELELAQNRVGVYGEQVTALVDQIDQNNRQYEKLLKEFKDSLVGFKGAMGKFNVTLTAEKDRATQEEGALANQLREQQQTLDQVMLTAKDILDIQKRLNQLHVYINQVRDTVTSDTTALQAGVMNKELFNLRDLITSLEQRYEQLALDPSSNPALTEHLQALEQQVKQSEEHYAETVQSLQNDLQAISVGGPTASNTQETQKLQALLTSLEQRYEQLALAPSSNPALTEHLQALEQRVKQSEKHYAETVQSLQNDLQAISVGGATASNTQETQKLQALLTSLEQRYEQLALAPSSNPALTEHLQALEQQVKQSDEHYGETIKALQHDVKKVSARMATLTESIGAETVEALHHDIQEVSAGMLKLAQSISHLEKTKYPTIPIHSGSITAPEGQP